MNTSGSPLDRPGRVCSYSHHKTESRAAAPHCKKCPCPQLSKLTRIECISAANSQKTRAAWSRLAPAASENVFRDGVDLLQFRAERGAGLDAEVLIDLQPHLA